MAWQASPPALQNKPNRDLYTLVNNSNLPATATWDAEFLRLLTSQPNWT